MPVRDRPTDEDVRRAARLRQLIGREVRDARRMAGVSQDRLGAAVGLSGSEIGRIERAEAKWLTITESVHVLRAVGLDLWLKTYPFASPIRDSAHTALIERFVRRLSPTITVRREWPIPVAGDHRALDLLLGGLPQRIGVEAETRILDEQALLRDLHGKQRDGNLARMCLLVLRSRSNVAALRHAPGLHREFPLRTRAVLAALGSGHDPGANGIIML
jgi:transcriptional regulator with XRE-family HTH domain